MSSSRRREIVRDALLTIDFVEEAFTRADMEQGSVTGEYAAAHCSASTARAAAIFIIR